MKQKDHQTVQVNTERTDDDDHDDVEYLRRRVRYLELEVDEDTEYLRQRVRCLERELMILKLSQ